MGLHARMARTLLSWIAHAERSWKGQEKLRSTPAHPKEEMCRNDNDDQEGIAAGWMWSSCGQRTSPGYCERHEKGCSRKSGEEGGGGGGKTKYSTRHMKSHLTIRDMRTIM